MRICLLADAQSPHTARWSAFFSARDHEVHVLSFRPTELAGVRVHALKWGSRLSKARYLFYPLTVRRLIRRLKPDILHAHHATSYGLAGALSGWHPYLVHTWGRDVLDFPKYWHYRAIVQFNLSRVIVAWDTPVYQHLIRHQESGWLVPHGDIEALAEAIRALLESEDRSLSLGVAAQRTAQEYDWPQVVRQLIPVLYHEA